MQSLLPLSAAGTARKASSDVITICRKGVPVLLLTGYSKENIVLPSNTKYVFIIFLKIFKNIYEIVENFPTRNTSHDKSRRSSHVFHPHRIIGP